MNRTKQATRAQLRPTPLPSSFQPTDERDVRIGALRLASGARLDDVVQRVTRYGVEPLRDGSNVVVLLHALTGSSRVAEWWSGLIGPDNLFDPARACLIGINVLGGCYGSTGPASRAPDGERYAERFPIVTVADMVDAQARALSEIGIERVALAIGGSLGGMQALQWAVRYGERVDEAVVVGAHDAFSALGIGLNFCARTAIMNDPNYLGGKYASDTPPLEGIRLARMIAMLSYKSDVLLEGRFANRPDRSGGNPAQTYADRFDVEGYLAYQGDLFARRMDANAYLALTRAMDLFDVRSEPIAHPTRTTLVGIENDWLFPPEYVRAAAERLRTRGVDATYLDLPSDHGHDAFLAETQTLAALIKPHLGAALSAR